MKSESEKQGLLLRLMTKIKMNTERKIEEDKEFKYLTWTVTNKGSTVPKILRGLVNAKEVIKTENIWEGRGISLGRKTASPLDLRDAMHGCETWTTSMLKADPKKWMPLRRGASGIISGRFSVPLRKDIHVGA